MPDPYDYTSTFANIPSPNAAILQGIQGGAALSQLQNQAQQQSAALAQQQQQKQVVQSLMSNPNASADDYAKAAVLVPQLSAQFKQAWDTKSAAQAQNDLKNMVQWSSAIQSGQPQIASQGMRDQAAAIENTAGGPTPESKALRTKADQVDANPNSANFVLKSMIAANPNGKTAIDGIVALGGEQRAQDLAPAAVRKANADAGTAEADNVLKAQQITAQKAGALAKVVKSPDQVQAFLQSEAKAGRITPDDLATFRANVPTDPAALPGFLNSIMTLGVKPDDQQKYVAPDANAKLAADTTKRGQDITARTASARLQFDKDQANTADAPDATPDAEKKLWVHQYVAGNGSVPRSAPAAVRNHIGTWAAEMGITPADLSSGAAQAKFDQASASTSGHRAGSMASVEATIPALISNARNLSRQLGQGKFVPLNQLMQMANDKISDPKLAAFKVGHQALASEYQQVISRGGTNVTALKEAMHVLNSAKSDEAYNAALDQVDKEVAINVAGTRKVRAGLGGAHGDIAPAQPTVSHPADISALLKKYGGQ
jgi:hypothetical protein